MHESFVFGQDSNQEIQRVVDNMFLIKLLNKEKEEVNRFSTTLDNLNSSLLNNHKYGILNFFPKFYNYIYPLYFDNGFKHIKKFNTRFYRCNFEAFSICWQYDNLHKSNNKFPCSHGKIL